MWWELDWRGGWTASSLAMALGWCPSWTYSQCVSHGSWGFGHPESENITGSPLGRLRELRGQSFCSERFLAHLWTPAFNTVHEYTDTRAHGFLGPLWRGMSLFLPSSLISCLPGASTCRVPLFTVQLRLWPWISQAGCAPCCSWSSHHVAAQPPLSSEVPVGSPPAPGTEATQVLTLESGAALPQYQSVSQCFTSFVISCKLDGPSMVSTLFSTPCLLKCFTRKYKKVVKQFSS